MTSRAVILDEDELREAVDFFGGQEEFVFDVEAAGENRGVPHLCSLTWLSMATAGKVAVIPFGHPIGTRVTEMREEKIPWGDKTRTIQVPVYEPPPRQIDRGTVFSILRPLFFREDIRKIAHGAVYDITSTAKYFGEVIPPPFGCTITEQWLLNETFAQDKGLKALVRQKYDFHYDNEDVGKCVEKHPFDLVAHYSYCDALYPWFLHQDFMPQLKAQGLTDIYGLEMDVLNVVVGMKLAGARVDIPRLEELRADLAQKKADAEAKVYAAAGRKFNLNSTPQKQAVLFTEQGLAPWKLTKGGQKKKKEGQLVTIKDYSTDDEVLESLAGNPVVDSLREFGDVDKLLGTYVEPWLSGLTYDEHIHADFVPYGTTTGRFSCRKPNLQNIPRPHTELGRLIRGAFIAEDDGMLVLADYSQIELVVLAHYLGRGKLFDGFREGIDPHRLHAAYVLGKSPEDVTSVERQDFGKTLGFAVCYGAGLRKVASMAKVSEKRAKEILAEYDRQFPEVSEYKSLVLSRARAQSPPHIRTLLGRKRRLPELKSRENGKRFHAERQCFNALIQGGAADLIKLAMVRVDGMLPPDVQCILTVHDEIVLSSPADLAEKSAAILNEAMTGPGIQQLISVPLKADVHIVRRWNESK